MTKTETMIPTSRAKMKAATETRPPKRAPTNGIQLSKAIIGENRSQIPNTVRQIPTILIQLADDYTSFS
jgi:hypothetical protein